MSSDNQNLPQEEEPSQPIAYIIHQAYEEGAAIIQQRDVFPNEGPPDWFIPAVQAAVQPLVDDLMARLISIETQLIQLNLQGISQSIRSMNLQGPADNEGETEHVGGDDLEVKPDSSE